MLSTLEAELRVRRGITFLDRNCDPHWMYQVNVDLLNQNHSGRCVLGQLYGDFLEGVEILCMHQKGAHNMGFLLPHMHYKCEEERQADYGILTATWRNAIITHRREQQPLWGRDSQTAWLQSAFTGRGAYTYGDCESETPAAAEPVRWAAFRAMGGALRTMFRYLAGTREFDRMAPLGREADEHRESTKVH